VGDSLGQVMLGHADTIPVTLDDMISHSASVARGAPLVGRTDLFVTPGFEFQRVSSLVTNFHLPRSSLLALVMAFAGVEETRRLYEVAIAERYRFYSFGDAMLIR